MIKLISIYKSNDRKFYCADYKINDKTHEVSLRTSNKREAKKNWKKLYDALTASILEPVNKPIIDIINEYLTKRSDLVQKSTLAGEESQLLGFMKYLKEKHNISDIIDLSNY